MSDNDQDHRYEQEAEELLQTIEQVEESVSEMAQVVNALREQVTSHLDCNAAQTVEMSAEEFLEQCDNLEGIWH